MKVKSLLITTLLTLTCVFGLTACGDKEVTLSKIDQNKVDIAVEYSTPVVESVINVCNGELSNSLSEYNNVELATVFEEKVADDHDKLAIEVEGKAVRNAITSFASAEDKLGKVDMSMVGAPTYDANDVGDTIIITCPVTSSNGNTGSVELIYSNDIYLVLESCTLNLNEGLSGLMEKAALNTLLGMGTVFVVLILISFIISAFGVIPKIQENLSKKKDTEKKEPVDNTIAQIIEKEELADDSELVAVIAAAIAAYEGSSSTDGFVVRSIKRANTNKWNKA